MECKDKSPLEVGGIYSRMTKTLNTIETVANSLLKNTAGCHQNNYEKHVSSCITDINKCMQDLKTICTKKKNELDSTVEQNVQMESQLKLDIKDCNLQIENQKCEMKKASDEIKRKETACNDASVQFCNAKKALDEAERKLKEAKEAQKRSSRTGAILIGAGRVASYIPGFTWIGLVATVAGGVLSVASLTSLEKDVNDKVSVVKQAESSKELFEKSLNDTKKRLEQLKNEIDTIRANEKRLTAERGLTSMSIEKIKEEQKKISKFLKMFQDGLFKLDVASVPSQLLDESRSTSCSYVKLLLKEFRKSYLVFAKSGLFEYLNDCGYSEHTQIEELSIKFQHLQKMSLNEHKDYN